jgi:class 3 adenylate cyclase
MQTSGLINSEVFVSIALTCLSTSKPLQAAAWNELGILKVRMGLHTGEAQLDPGGDEYAASHTKNRIRRIHPVASNTHLSQIQMICKV